MPLQRGTPDHAAPRTDLDSSACSTGRRTAMPATSSVSNEEDTRKTRSGGERLSSRPLLGGPVKRPRKATVLVASLAFTLVVFATGCSGTPEVAAAGSVLPTETRVEPQPRIAGYSADPETGELTLFFSVAQLVTLRGVSVVSEDSEQVTVSADLSQRSGNSVAMLGYVWGTVQLGQPLGQRRVLTVDQTVVRPINLADVGPSPGPERTAWTPG